MKVAVYGAGYWADKLYHFLSIFKGVEIVCFIQSSPDKKVYNGIRVIPANKIGTEQFDRLVIATSWLYYEEIMTHIKRLDNYESFCSRIMRIEEIGELVCKEHEACMPYMSVDTEDGLKFIADSKDFTIPVAMLFTGCVWSRGCMDMFLDLIKRYYEIDKSKIMLDIGANIGTTALYYRKKGFPVIAFEAGEQNYRLCRTNCIINGYEDLPVEHIALSDEKGTGKYYYNLTNSGGSGFFMGDNIKMQAYEESFCTLDEYLDEKGILPEKIGYIWMDTEGYEAKIIHGGLDLLSKHKIPLWHEFNPFTYQRQGNWDRYLEDVSGIYEHYIDSYEFKDGKYIVRNINELCNHPDLMRERKISQSDIFFF